MKRNEMIDTSKVRYKPFHSDVVTDVCHEEDIQFQYVVKHISTQV